MSDDITKSCMLSDYQFGLPDWIQKFAGTPFFKEALEIELESMRATSALRDEQRASDLGSQRGPDAAAAREVISLKLWAERLEYDSAKEKLAIRYVAWLHAGATIDEAKRTAELTKAQEIMKSLPKKGEPKNSHEHPPKGYPEKEGEYADPKNHKYPLDSEKHVRAAISYFSVAKNAGEYSAAEQKTMWGRIHSAAKKHSIEISDLKKGEDDIDKGVNPWAVCHASTGPGKTAKFEDCVQDVKKKEGIHKGEDVVKAIDVPPTPGPSAPAAAPAPPPVTKSEEEPKKTTHLVYKDQLNIVTRDLTQAQEKAAAMLKAQRETADAREQIRQGLNPQTQQYGGFASGFKFGPGSGR